MSTFQDVNAAALAYQAALAENATYELAAGQASTTFDAVVIAEQANVEAALAQQASAVAQAQATFDVALLARDATLEPLANALGVLNVAIAAYVPPEP